ncbi:MAG: hypothetical protein OXN27_25775 [Candidatus Poribacteria bacterium]|nr:hypothetical protein [Candidatus Poribacteria bacterium]
MARCKCGIRIWKGSRCEACRNKALETSYGLSFHGSCAKPTEKFWRAWRKDSDAVKRRGLRVRKEGSVWIVSKAPRMM